MRCMPLEGWILSKGLRTSAVRVVEQLESFEEQAEQ